jgi:hypothetical protein
MRGFRVPAGLSDLVISRKLEQRFGLLGFARMVKLVELVAAMSDADSPASVVVAWGDFMVAVGCNQEAAGEFLAYCEQARVIDRATEDGRLRLTLIGELAVMVTSEAPPPPVPAGPVLYTTDKQWKDWFIGELACSPYLANDPSTRQLFRRWCATNVTIDEIEAAVELAIKASEAPTPAALHDHLKTVRNTKIERARQ